MLVQVEGVVVGIRENAFEGFTDPTGRDVPSGVTRLLWLSIAYSAAPVQCKFPATAAAEFDKVKVAAFGDRVRITGDSRQERITVEAADFLAAKPAAVKSA